MTNKNKAKSKKNDNKIEKKTGKPMIGPIPDPTSGHGTGHHLTSHEQMEEEKDDNEAEDELEEEEMDDENDDENDEDSNLMSERTHDDGKKKQQASHQPSHSSTDLTNEEQFQQFLMWKKEQEEKQKKESSEIEMLPTHHVGGKESTNTNFALLQNSSDIPQLKGFNNIHALEKWVYAVNEVTSTGSSVTITSRMSKDCAALMSVKLTQQHHHDPASCPADTQNWRKWEWSILAKALDAMVTKRKNINNPSSFDTYLGIKRRILQILFPQSYHISEAETKATKFQGAIMNIDSEMGHHWETFTIEQKHALFREIALRICSKPEEETLEHILQRLAAAFIKAIPTMNTLHDAAVTIGEIASNYALHHSTSSYLSGENSRPPVNVKCLPLYAQPKKFNSGDNDTFDSDDDDKNRNKNNRSSNSSKHQKTRNQSQSSESSKKRDRTNGYEKGNDSKKTKKQHKEHHHSSDSEKGFSDGEEDPREGNPPPLRGDEVPDNPNVWCCWLCGRIHTKDDCLLKRHPDVNYENRPWKDSKMGRAWKAKGYKDLPGRITLRGKKPRLPEYTKGMKASAEKKKGMTITERINMLTTDFDENDLIPCCIEYRGREIKAALALIDTGALNGNYISRTLADELKKLGMTEFKHAHNIDVCTVVNDCSDCNPSCVTVENYLYFDLNIKNVIPSHIPTILYNKRMLNVQASIIPMKYDLIIGLPTIRQHKLMRILASHFDEKGPMLNEITMLQNEEHTAMSETVAETAASAVSSSFGVEGSRNPNGMLGKARSFTGVHCRSCGGDAHTCQETNDSVAQVQAWLAVLQTIPSPNEVKSLDELLDFDVADVMEDPFEGMVDLGDYLPPSDRKTIKNVDNLDNLPKLTGDSPFYQKIRALCAKFENIFSREVRSIPANVEPLELRLKEGSKFLTTPGGPARMQSTEKRAEIDRQIDQMLRLGVIRQISTSAYSQVILSPKPGGKWRFCIDYRRLNKELESEYWVIPNIRSLMHRIGNKKPRYFAVVDLTSGYHQTPLSANSRKLSAFVTERGVFEWVRVPMGVHVAPAYFQRQIANTIMADLIYQCMEVYIDDIIIYGNTEEEFLENLQKLFMKCGKYNLTLHPDKCKLGLEKIEYVGHVIDKDGLHMSDDKIRKVIDFARPKKVKELQSFLGFVNYFRDHIRNHSMITQPLYAMYTNKDRGGTILKWTQPQIDAFEHIKIAIEQCPKLYFLESHQEYDTFVETDASDYGIGAYVYQRNKQDQKERPVAFLSKSLTGAEKRWSTIEKEQYAIFYALKKWEYLLRGIPFTLRTDHKNLLQMNDGSPKVLRWKLALQEFNCKVEHLPGKDNQVADSLSRLVPTIMDPPKQSTVQVLAGLAVRNQARIDDDHFKIITNYHNTLAGHWGVEKTIDLMKKNQVDPWTYMRRDIRRFIKECPVCQKLSQMPAQHNIAPYTLATYEPMQRLSIDTIGPIGIGNKEDNKHILVIIDNFTRFVSLYPCKSTDAEEAARHLLTHVGYFGQPEQIQSDKGTQFVNDMIKYLCQRMGVEQLHGMAYSKEENSIVERANKEVLRHLRAYIYDKNVLKIWVDCLPLVQRIMNASTHESTGLSPAQILFGNAIDLDRGIFTNYEAGDKKSNNTRVKKNLQMREYIEQLYRAQEALISRAQAHQEQLNMKHLEERAPQGPISEYTPNSYVLIAYPDSGMGRKPPTKLHTPWRGPRRVIRSEGARITVQNLLNGNTETVHISSVKPFIFDSTKTDPKMVATRDDQETFVESVLWHVGDFNKKKELRFKVKYMNTAVTDRDDDLVPWRELSRVKALHQYLREQGLQKYIPTNLEEWEIEDNILQLPENVDEPNLLPPNHTAVTTIPTIASSSLPQPNTNANNNSPILHEQRQRKRKLPPMLPDARKKPKPVSRNKRGIKK